MAKICELEGCTKVVKSKRNDAKYCSPKHRTAAMRQVADRKVVPVLASMPKPTAEPQKEPGPYNREAALAAFQKMGLQKVDWITSGIAELDAFQMIPRGRVTQIQGPYAVGKTTLALNMIRGLRDKKVLYIDSEASLNPELLVDMELNPDNFHLWNDTSFVEDIYDQVILGAKSGLYDMIILDSLAACTTKTEEEGQASARNIGQKALIVNKLMRIAPMQCKNTDTALIIINQEREMIGTYVPTKYTPGGMGPIYAASLILGLKTIPSWRFPKDAPEGYYKGHQIEVTIIKSKVSQPHRKTKIKLYYLNSQAEIKEPAGIVDQSKEAF